MDRYLNKKYRLVESENYDAYLRRNKVELFFRKLEHIVKQTIKLTEKDEKYIFETMWPMTVSQAVFRPGVPFTEKRIDGALSKSIIDFKENKMIHIQSVMGVQTTFIREYSDKQVNVTTFCGDIVCYRKYARVYER